ncbi:uncharacterized protein JCM15063_004686 [Sporobolomyces koalae]|uniref:uncharacterized protein n=1 Tax=Sporobolomyces koalae TaxID=500713 RepID=UPI00317330EC
MVPYLYPAPPPSTPTGCKMQSEPTFSANPFFSSAPSDEQTLEWRNLPTWAAHSQYLDSPPPRSTLRRNSLGLELADNDSLERMEEDSPQSLSPCSPPLVPFSLPSTCPASPPLIAISLPPFNLNPSESESASRSAASPSRPNRPVPHPLAPKLRLEMTPLPAFSLPLPDVDMSPPSQPLQPSLPSLPTLPWTTSFDLEAPRSRRKNSLVDLPVGPPTPPLTPSEEAPAFCWDQKSSSLGITIQSGDDRGRSHQVNPLFKASCFSACSSNDPNHELTRVF